MVDVRQWRIDHAVWEDEGAAMEVERMKMVEVQ